MKNLVKLITVNDGTPEIVQNGDRLFVETYPRTEKIITLFLNNGYSLVNMEPVYNPSTLEEGSFSFYRGRKELLFVKEVESDEPDSSDELLSFAIQTARDPASHKETGFEESWD